MSLLNDTEKSRWVSRIMAITFRIAKSLPPGTISRPWVAKYLNRSEDFVKQDWIKDPFFVWNPQRSQSKHNHPVAGESRYHYIYYSKRKEEHPCTSENKLKIFAGRGEAKGQSSTFYIQLERNLLIKSEPKMLRTECGSSSSWNTGMKTIFCS